MFCKITDTWVIYVRQRNEDFRKEDIRRLIKKVDEVESEAELPQPGVRFVEEPSNVPTVQNDGTLIDLADTDLTLPTTTLGPKIGPAPAGSGGGSHKSVSIGEPIGPGR